MEANGLVPFGRFGPDPEAFVKQQVADIEALSREIGLVE